MPQTHEMAWRYIFDWAVAGEALHCAPGDLVLEFGAGTCFASELFNRLGYHTVSLDINPEILSYARDRMSLDRRLDSSRSSYVAGDGQSLPFAGATFDGVICLNALHHMPDYAATLSEVRRVLKPGARADIELGELPCVVASGQEIAFRALVRNSGDTLWLSAPREFGGHVTFGVKLCLPDGRMLADNLGRTPLDHDVSPGDRIEVSVSFELPDSLTPGRYLLRFDMVDELITWFGQAGSVTLQHRFVVADAQAGRTQRFAARSPVPQPPSTRSDSWPPLDEGATPRSGMVGAGLGRLKSLVRSVHALLRPKSHRRR